MRIADLCCAAGGAAMGIPWMSRYELTQAIPPAYSRHIGERISRVVLDA